MFTIIGFFGKTEYITQILFYNGQCVINHLWYNVYVLTHYATPTKDDSHG